MPGIIPVAAAGAVSIGSASVENAVVPDAPFDLTCDPLALPSNCNARILPKQINAIVSELLALAAAMDPDGVWDCNELNNLSEAFNNSAVTIVNLICASTPAKNALKACLGIT